MKHLFVGLLLMATLAVNAQSKPAPKKPATTPAKPATAPVLKNLNDSVSYAIGLTVARFYSQQGINTLNGALVSRAINDVFGKKKELMTEEQGNLAIMRFLNPGLFQNIEEGERFLAANKSKPGVKTTPSGLQYEIIQQGTGPRPSATDTVEVHYAGSLLNGIEFDNSIKRGAPLTIPLANVIKGWTEGVQLMPVGSKFKFYIPYQLGYGMNDTGGAIPGGSVLIFEVELLNIVK